MSTISFYNHEYKQKYEIEPILTLFLLANCKKGGKSELVTIKTLNSLICLVSIYFKKFPDLTESVRSLHSSRNSLSVKIQI